MSLFVCLLLLVSGLTLSISLWADDMSGNQPEECTFPPGIYRIQKLGAGFDSLTLTVSHSRDIGASYRLLQRKSGKYLAPLFQVWLDAQTADISCSGDSIVIRQTGSRTSGVELNLSVSWDRDLSSLNVDGTFVAPDTWLLWFIKTGLVSINAVSSIGLSLNMAGWWEVGGWNTYSTTRKFFSVCGYSIFGFELMAFSLIIADKVFSYSLIDSNRRYSLAGSGVRLLGDDDYQVCRIPPGTYHGQWLGGHEGTLQIEFSVDVDNKNIDIPVVSVSKGSNRTVFRVEPWRFEYSGYEILLDWDSSLPESSGALIAHYDEVNQRLFASGFFSSTKTGSIFHSNKNIQTFVMDELLLIDYGEIFPSLELE